MKLKELVRPNIWNLNPYSCARSEFKGNASVFLDANENPFNSPFNRYPDPLQLKVKEKIAQIKDVLSENIFLGVGSDECIDMAYRTFCVPGVDNVVAMSPSYGMYEVCADINDIEYRKVNLTETFELDVDALINATDDHSKIIWLCSPNNPTGNAFDIERIKEVYDRFSGILIVDEAYIDFSSKGSMIKYIDELPRLIVLQTFSKAWGSAGVRLGVAYSNKEIIGIYSKVKYPYNVNILTQNYAIDMLENYKEVTDWVSKLLRNRLILKADLQKLSCVQKIYPTDANFMLVKVNDADALYDYLRNENIIVRNRNKIEKCLGCLRITVGTENENAELIAKITDYEGKE